MPVARPTDDDDSRRANGFFERGRVVAETGNYDYAIEMYIKGLEFTPDNVEAHQALRIIALRRTAGGGKPMGMVQRMKLPRAKEPRQAMLNAQKLLAYEPGNVTHMFEMLRAARAAGMTDTTRWIEAILKHAIGDQRRMG